MMQSIRRTLLTTALILVSVFCVTLPAAALGFDAEKTFDSVVVVYSGNQMGSGFAIGKDCIVTNAHVISGSAKTTVLSYSDVQYSTTVYAIDRYYDVAILKVTDADFAPLPVGSAESFRVGDDVYAIGAPRNLPYTLTKGIVSTKEREIEGRSYIQIDAAINEGNSGGPLLTNRGEVIGVNSMKLEDSQGIGWAIPMTVVFQVMEDNGLYLTDAGVLETKDAPSSQPGEPAPTPPQENGDGAQPPAQDPQPQEPQQDPQPQIPQQEPQDSSITGVLIAVLCVTAVAAALTTVLVYRRNRKKTIQVDPTDRTDFDIELLE